MAGGALMLAGMLSMPAAAFAQQVEASFEAGYTTSEGFNATQSRVILGQVYNSFDVASGGSYGFTIGAFVSERFEVEFLYSRQSSEIQISEPSPTRKLANQDVENYHGVVSYNWGGAHSAFRPYIFAGLGATHYLPGDYDPSLPNSGAISTIASVSKFSSTWGGGVKFYPSTNLGVKASVRWTPTYVKTNDDGLWCDPFYGTCWVVGTPDYSNQVEFSGGVTFRFGGL